jgi:hypothetical protein
MTLQQLLGIELPVIQTPMAGAQGSALDMYLSGFQRMSEIACR